MNTFFFALCQKSSFHNHLLAALFESTSRIISQQLCFRLLRSCYHFDHRGTMDRRSPMRKRNPRASRPPLIPSANLINTKATAAAARKSIPASIPSVPSVSIQIYDIFAEPVDPNEVNLSCLFILTYDRHCSPFFQADNNNPFAVNSFKADSNPFAVNSFKPHVDVSYRESLLSFVKELGPKAKMVATRKLQSAELLDIGAVSGGAASPGLFLRSNSFPTTTERPPMLAPAPPQPQSTTTTAARRGDMGGASSPGLFFRNYSLPPTTEPPPPLPYKPLPLQPQSTMTTTARRSDMGGASSPGLFFRDYSLPSTTEPPPLPHKPLPLQPQSTMTTTTTSPGLFFRDYSFPPTTEQPPPLHRPLPLQPQPTMATTRRAEMGGATSPGLFFRNYSHPSATTEPPPPPPPPLPPQPKPTITPQRKNETREAAGGAVHGSHPTEENVRPVILALENPHANHHSLESRNQKIKRSRLRSTHNDESMDRGHSQAVADLGQKHKKPKSPPPSAPPVAAAASSAPSFPFDMCFLKAKLDRMNAQRSPIGRKGDNKFATGLQSWTGNPILADQRRFF